MVRLVSRMTSGSSGANNEGKNVCGTKNKIHPKVALTSAAHATLNCAANLAPSGSPEPSKEPTRAEPATANATGNIKQNVLMDW